MEFGVMVPQGWRLDLMGVEGYLNKWETFKRISRQLDCDGWESLWVYDHFHTFPRKKVEATFEAWTMMATLAEITESARIGQLVTCVQYRTPAYLAKVAACVDVASGGRLNLGLGSGWFEEEFGAYGYDFMTKGKRLQRLAETLEVVKLLFTESEVDYEGRHYQLREAVCEPKPLQQPHPPIWIGGRGPKVLLRLVAQHADVWNFNGPLEEFADTVEILKSHCLDVGRDFDEIRCTAMSGGIAYDSDEELERFFERIEAQNIRRENLLTAVHCKGSREQCAEHLHAWRRAGCDGMIFFFQDIGSAGDGGSQAEVFKRDILPALQAAD
ncbi:MAG: TIGR03560 family F420-dependent LLM class oxidoreductase [Deltaproteobacteria bacterium]